MFRCALYPPSLQVAPGQRQREALARGLTDGVLIPARSRISRRRWSGCGGQARALRTPQATACPKNRSQQGCSWTPLVTATSPPSPVYSRSKIGHRTCSHGWATPLDVRRSQVALIQVALLLSRAPSSRAPCSCPVALPVALRLGIHDDLSRRAPSHRSI